jgi:hypothetical protein
VQTTVATPERSRVESDRAGPAEQPAGSHLKLGAALLNVAICVCAFGLTAAALHQLRTSETRPLAVAKLEAFLQDKDQFDIVAVGNSHVYRHVVPEVLEQELARHGVPGRTYNLGAPSMSFDELVHQVRAIAAAKPARLRVVLIGLTVDLEFASQTPDVFQLLVGALSPDGSLEYSGRALQYDLHRFANRGEGPEILRRGRRWLLAGASPPALTQDGYIALDDEVEPSYAARSNHFQQSLDGYAEYVAELARDAGPLAPYSPRQAALMQQVTRMVREAGAEPVFLMPPVFRQARFFSEPEGHRLLRYDDPALHPEFFEVADRFDNGHLNRNGAEILTRQIARDLASGR